MIIFILYSENSNLVSVSTQTPSYRFGDSIFLGHNLGKMRNTKYYLGCGLPLGVLISLDSTVPCGCSFMGFCCCEAGDLDRWDYFCFKISVITNPSNSFSKG